MAAMPSLMDGTYFVSKSDLLSFINTTLGLNLQKIEQTANGAVACQLLDALKPGMVPLAKVDFNAASEYEMIGNYKLLQAAFSKAGVNKDVEVARLMKGKPLDNMEFMQWMKAFVDGQTGGLPISNYDGPARRAESRTGDLRSKATMKRRPAFNSSNGQTGRVSNGGGSRGKTLTFRASTDTVRSPRARSNYQAAATSANSANSDQSTEREPAADSPAAADQGRHPSAAASARNQRFRQDDVTPAAEAALGAPGMQQQLREKEAQVSHLETAADTAGKERDFYFSKLRDIEILCQTPGLGHSKVIQVVERILYAQNDEDAKRIIAEAQVSLVAELAGPEEPPAAVAADGAEIS